MAILIADILESVRWQEEDGVVTSIDRGFLITGLPVPHGTGDGVPGIPGMPVNDEVMRFALDHGNLPGPGDSHPIESHLSVTKRTPRIIGPRTVMVTVTYGGSFEPPFTTNFLVSGGASVEQTERALHRLGQSGGPPYGSGNPGEQITVKWTPPGASDAIIQNGEITPFEGRSVLSFVAQIARSDPWTIIPDYVNKVNLGSFFYAPGAAPRTWLITDMNFDVVSKETPTSAPIYEMSMTMRHNPDTWDPFVIYIDEKTGRPPGPDENGQGGLTAGEGYKRVKWHDEISFDILFQ